MIPLHWHCEPMLTGLYWSLSLGDSEKKTAEDAENTQTSVAMTTIGRWKNNLLRPVQDEAERKLLLAALGQVHASIVAHFGTKTPSAFHALMGSLSQFDAFDSTTIQPWMEAWMKSWQESFSNEQTNETQKGEEIGALLISTALLRLHEALQSSYSKLSQQLPLRIRPLQDQWLGYGSGLMACMKRTTRANIARDRLRVIAVQPIRDGFGFTIQQPKPIERSFVIEAVLTNPIANLPEVLRLGWLIAQTASISPDVVETPSRDDVHQQQAAWLVATLFAASELELIPFQPSVTALALENWMGNLASDQALSIANNLHAWWTEHTEALTAWDVSLSKLGSHLVDQ